MDVTPLIEAEGLTIGHRSQAIATDIALSVAPGEVLVLLGPNGAGKTTLFRTLLGLIPALAGNVRLSGRNLASLSRIEIARAAALVPQSLHAVPQRHHIDHLARSGRASALPEPRLSRKPSRWPAL